MAGAASDPVPKPIAAIRRHPVVAYFVLAFVISWGGIIVVVGPSKLLGTKAEFEAMYPTAIGLMLLGPTIAGLGLAVLVYGRAGMSELGRRLARYRVALAWYAAALLPAPLYFLTVLIALSAWSPQFMPAIFSADDKAALVVRGLVAGAAAGLFEELGWTGFAVPTLRRRHGVFATGLIVGLLWGVWHFLVKVWASAAFGLGDFMTLDLLGAVIGLTGYRILMVWVYDRSGSLLIAMLMHASLTASTIMLGPIATGADLVNANLLLAAVPWLIIAVAALARPRSAQPRPHPMAGAHP